MKSTVFLSASVIALLIAVGAFIYKIINQEAVVIHVPERPIVQAPVTSPPDNPIEDQLPHDFKPATYNEAFTAAQRHGKKLFIIFSASWCGPCQNMKRDVWSDQKVKDRLAEYIVYNVDVDKEPEVATQYGVRSMPTYGIYEIVDGKPKVVKQASGGRSAKSMIEWLP